MRRAPAVAVRVAGAVLLTWHWLVGPLLGARLPLLLVLPLLLCCDLPWTLPLFCRSGGGGSLSCLIVVAIHHPFNVEFTPEQTMMTRPWG